MILATLATDIQNLPTMLLALQKFDVKGDNLELNIIINLTWWQRETLNLTMETFVREINSKHNQVFSLV